MINSIKIKNKSSNLIFFLVTLIRQTSLGGLPQCRSHRVPYYISILLWEFNLTVNNQLYDARKSQYDKRQILIRQIPIGFTQGHQYSTIILKHSLSVNN